MNTVNFWSNFRSDRTMSTVWTDSVSGVVIYRATGRFSYDGSILTYYFPPSTQAGEISWMDADHFNYRTVQSTVPGAVGVDTLMTRSKQ